MIKAPVLPARADAPSTAMPQLVAAPLAARWGLFFELWV